MGMTMTQKILASPRGTGQRAGAGSSLRPSWIWCWATTSPPPWPSTSLKTPASPRFSTRDKIAMVMDHFAPNKDIKAASSVQAVPRPLRSSYDIDQFLRRGPDGHRARPAAGKGPGCPRRVPSSAQTPTPAPTVRWAHSPPASAPRIWRAGMATGEAWFKVPSAIQRQPHRQAPALCLRQGRDSAPHRHDRRGRRTVPVHGVYRPRRGQSLTMDDRLTICQHGH